MPSNALASPIDLEQLTGDLVASISDSPRGTLDSALKQALEHTIEAKVQAQLAVVLEGIGDAFYSLDDQWRFSYINRTAESYFGVPRHAMLRRPIWDLFPESEGTDLRRRYEEVFASGQPLSFETEAVGRRGRYLEFHVFPYKGGLGVSFRDWTERRRAEDELRESQARLSSLTDNVPACMLYQLNDAADYKDRRLLYISKTCEQVNGIPAEKVQADLSLLYELVLPQYRERMLAKEIEAVREHKAFDMEFEMRHGRTGEVRWHRLIVTPRLLSSGIYVWDGLQIDITEHKRAEEHLQLLVNELNHRVKNTLATVQSLAAQSFSRLGPHVGGDVQAARTAFEARLFALARAHDVLTRENWEGADLPDVLAEACTPYRSGAAECSRIEIAGPDLRVSPPMALSLSMILHELFTNAIKYGALSNASGAVRISWSVPTVSGGQRLCMRWEEHDGPPVKPPSRKGFGSRLIQDGLARELNGTVSLNYEPDGVICTVDVPLS